MHPPDALLASHGRWCDAPARVRAGAAPLPAGGHPPRSLRMRRCGISSRRAGSNVGRDDQLRDTGWITDTRGYRYDARDPVSGNRGPRCPMVHRAGRGGGCGGGFAGFVPDVCLINRYEPGALTASGPQRAGSRGAHRIGLARIAGDVRLRRAAARRSHAADSGGARRCRRVGRPGANARFTACSRSRTAFIR